MYENGSGTENEIHYKQNKVYDSNDSQRKEEVSEQVKAENIPRTNKYRYLRIHNNRNKWKRKSKRTHWRIKAKLWGNKQGNRDDRIKGSSWEGGDKSSLKKLFEACFIASIDTWSRKKYKEIETIQGKALKRIFKLPVSATHLEILIKTGIWLAAQAIQYVTLMLYYKGGLGLALFLFNVFKVYHFYI